MSKERHIGESSSSSTSERSALSSADLSSRAQQYALTLETNSPPVTPPSPEHPKFGPLTRRRMMWASAPKLRVIPGQDINCSQKIAVGSSGTVFKASLRLTSKERPHARSWSTTRITVAAKCVNALEAANLFGSQTSLTAEKNDLFVQECKLLSELRHANIVRFLGVTSLEQQAGTDTLTLITEYCPRNLSDLVFSPREKLSAEMVLHIALGCARGMAHCHLNDVVHRDLKFDNILLDDRGNVKICDFGLSRRNTRDFDFLPRLSILSFLNRPLTNMTGDVGTPTFLAPELLDTDSAVATHSVDVYSYGILLCCMCSRTMPYAEFSNASCFELLEGVVTNDLRPVLPLDASMQKKWQTAPAEVLAAESGKRSPATNNADPASPLFCKPEMIYGNQVARIPPGLLSMAKACWNKSAANRPTFKSVVETLEQAKKLLQNKKLAPKYATSNLVEIAKQLRQAVSVEDRSYHLRSYRQVAIGSELVTALITLGHANSIEEAEYLGDLLVTNNLVSHTCNDHGMKNLYLFYTFSKLLDELPFSAYKA
jgi:serine/threonine protein kinase